MNNRDDFSAQTKRILALRAGYLCSFPGCGQRTVGPSDESSRAVANIGEAAHICAASPRGKRYVASMTPDERSSIDNGIWFCANHATLVDRNDATYTIESLREMKRNHELASAQELRGALARSTFADDLIAIGPDIVCVGELMSVAESVWVIQIKHFVVGDVATLVSFIDCFANSPNGDRYVLVNALGDGRLILQAPRVIKSGTGYSVQCHVSRSFPRIDAHALGTDFAISTETNDLMLAPGGSIAVVSGLASLPQRIRCCLSLQRGESPFHPEFGTRFAQYYDAFRASPWLANLLKLEVIRQASIAYNDEVLGRQHTPLQSVGRVWSVDVLPEGPKAQWLSVRIDLDVQGVGRRQWVVSVFIPPNPGAAAPRPSMSDIAAGVRP